MTYSVLIYQVYKCDDNSVPAYAVYSSGDI